MATVVEPSGIVLRRRACVAKDLVDRATRLEQDGRCERLDSKSLERDYGYSRSVQAQPPIQLVILTAIKQCVDRMLHTQ